MKKIFTAFAMLMLLSTNIVFADDYPTPQLPPKEKFVLFENSSWLCGNLTINVYVDTAENTRWLLGYWDGEEKEFFIQRDIGANIHDIWVRVNRGEHVWEHFSSVDALMQKYPTPCDAVR